MPMPRLSGRAVRLALSAMLVASGAALAADAPKPNEMGEYVTADGTPTYHVAPDGTVDWYTYSGFLRYGASCLQCHGPDGLGSSYAPNLTDALKNLSYDQFRETVIAGKQDVNAAQNLVMPSFGTNPNVMCYLDEIYVYLKARSDGAVGRGRPDKHEPKTKDWTENENACMG